MPYPSEPAKTTGRFNYLSNRTEPSLFRNGKVLTRRDQDGSDTGFVGIDKAAHSLNVIDARRLGKTCEANGFELLSAPLQTATIDFHDHQQVATGYYPDCEALVAEATGARTVHAFDHNIRSAQGKRAKQRIAGGQQVQGPAKMVHGDYTLTSAPQRLRDLTEPPKRNDTLSTLLPAGRGLLDDDAVAQSLADSGRFAIINVWRNIVSAPVQSHPLAMCDGQTVEPRDLVTFEIHYHDRVGENYFAQHHSRHQFYYYPEMTRDEVLLLKQWDSAGALAQSKGQRSDSSQAHGPCTFSFHSAFDDAQTPAAAPDRWSIEVRCAVLYD